MFGNSSRIRAPSTQKYPARNHDRHLSSLPEALCIFYTGIFKSKKITSNNEAGALLAL